LQPQTARNVLGMTVYIVTRELGATYPAPAPLSKHVPSMLPLTTILDS
jgi:hypothetical protein